MIDVTIADALRYLFTGLVPLALLYICDREVAVRLVHDLSLFGVSLFAALLGSIVYHVYRPLLYQSVIAPIQDLFRHRTDSPRTLLARRYGISRYQAVLLWRHIAFDAFRDLRPSWRKEASAVHLLYMSSVMAFACMFWQVAKASTAGMLSMLSICITLAVGGFMHDRSTEDYEVLACRSLGESRLDEYAKVVGFLGRTSD